MTVRARKSLGQHFLRHPDLLRKIAQATGAQRGDVVLEIGPGEGTLTEALLATGAMVVAIERDERMIEILQRKFMGRDFALVVGDALALDWAALVAPWTALGKRWLVAGNIPYYITSPLLDRALTPPLPAIVTFLVQKEVADRVVAAAGEEAFGGLSIGIQVAAEAERLFTVGRGAFVPPPKVDSAVLRLTPHATPRIPVERIGDFRRLVTSLFSYRRKTMLRALREARGLGADQAAAVLRAAAIAPDVRPEVIPVEGWIRLLAALDETRE